MRLLRFKIMQSVKLTPNKIVPQIPVAQNMILRYQWNKSWWNRRYLQWLRLHLAQIVDTLYSSETAAIMNLINVFIFFLLKNQLQAWLGLFFQRNRPFVSSKKQGGFCRMSSLSCRLRDGIEHQRVHLVVSAQKCLLASTLKNSLSIFVDFNLIRESLLFALTLF